MCSATPTSGSAQMIGVSNVKQVSVIAVTSTFIYHRSSVVHQNLFLIKTLCEKKLCLPRILEQQTSGLSLSLASNWVNHKGYCKGIGSIGVE